MNNGTRKGGEPETMQTVHSSPGLEDLWQLHFSLLSGQEYTQPGMFIANTVDDPPPADAHCSDGRAARRTKHAPAARPQWQGLLDQALSPARRHLHRNQPSQRLQQNLHAGAQLTSAVLNFRLPDPFICKGRDFPCFRRGEFTSQSLGAVAAQ